MEFYILRNQLVSTETGNYQPPSSIPVERVLNVPEARVQATTNDDGTDNQKYADKLITALVENPWGLKNKRNRSEVDWSFNAAITLPKPNNPFYISPDGGRVDQPGILKISVKSTEGEDNFLEVLHNTFNVHGGDARNVTLNVFVKNFGSTRNFEENPCAICWKAKGLMLEKVDDGSNNTVIACNCPFMPSRSSDERRFLRGWNCDWEEFSGIFTISVVLNNSALSLLNSLNQVPREVYRHFKDMLEKEIWTDLEIHAGLSPNHSAIKCHGAILAAGSTVFKKMFENGKKEATGNKIEIEEMSEKGVRALLTYLYYRETKAAYESSEVALELLKAGEKYDIQGLKDAVREVMMAKESAWFGVDGVLALYDFVRELCSKEEVEIADEAGQEDDDGIEMKTGEDKDEEMEVWKSLKLKCFRTLKWYFKKEPETLLQSAKYQEILKGNLKLVMEINIGIARLD